MRPTSSLVALHAAVALFGFAALFGAWIAWPAVAIVLGRTVVAAVALALLQIARGDAIGRASALTIVNGALLAMHWVAFFAAVQAADVATALLGFASFPAFVLLIERVVRGRAPSASETAMVIAVAAGLALIVPDYSWSSGTARGLLWGIASGITFALLVVRNRSAVAIHGAISLALWQNAFAAIWLVPVAALVADASPVAVRDVLLVIALGVFCTALAHTLFIASLRRVSAHAASVVSLLEPVYGIALAALLLNQWPGVRTLTGAVLIVGAAIVATWRTRIE